MPQSSIISNKVVHNYLAFISIGKIPSGIDIKGTVTSYIWIIKGVFLFDLQFDELILVSLFVYMGGVGEPKLKENIHPTLLDGFKMDFR